MKKVLITGVNSYIGTSFETYASSHYPEEFQIDTIDMIDGTWKDKDFSGYDIVFHVAGIAHADVGKVTKEIKAKYYAVNTNLAIETARKAKEDGVKQFVFMSSSIIYGDSAPYGKKKHITKDTKPHPSNFYGDSKWRADKGVRKLSDENFTVTVLRPPMIYGKGSKGNYPTLAKLAKILPVFPDVKNERSMLYIENLCEFLCQVMMRGEGGIFWPQNSSYSNTSRLVRYIGRLHGHDVRLSKALGLSVRVGSLMPGKVGGLVKKAFGNLVYEKNMSEYDFNYQKYSLKESLIRTETSDYNLDELANDRDNNPLVSVIMATYNDKPEYIKQSIDSIINQTYKNFELIILDDSTAEDTKAAIDSYSSDSRVKIYREEQKLGFVPSLNKGLNLAKGEYIARMDGDDVSSLDRFSKQVNYLNTHPKTDILGGQINVIDEDGVVTGSRSYPLGGLKLIAFFTLRTPVAHPTVMFRRSIVDSGHRYDESLPKAEDIDFWIRLYNEGYRFNNIPDTIVDFRVESDFMEKRVTNHDQENYVLKARRDNFTWKRPVFSAVDYIMSYVREWTPDVLKARQYQNENGK